MWRIYYGDGSVVRGSTAADWRCAPDMGVQVVVLMAAPHRPRWTYEHEGETRVVRDRQMFTGEDEYDPFGGSPKYGAWLTDEAYFAVWKRACSD